MHHYHFTYSKARTFPLGTAVLMMRHVRDCKAGGDSPDNPLVMRMVRARALVRRWYRATHEIIPNEEGAGA